MSEQKPLTLWNKSDIIDWLKSISQLKYESVFQKSDITGVDLPFLTRSILRKKMSIAHFHDQNEILNSITKKILEMLKISITYEEQTFIFQLSPKETIEQFCKSIKDVFKLTNRVYIKIDNEILSNELVFAELLFQDYNKYKNIQLIQITELNNVEKLLKNYNYEKKTVVPQLQSDIDKKEDAILTPTNKYSTYKSLYKNKTEAILKQQEDIIPYNKYAREIENITKENMVKFENNIVETKDQKSINLNEDNTQSTKKDKNENKENETNKEEKERKEKTKKHIKKVDLNSDEVYNKYKQYEINRKSGLNSSQSILNVEKNNENKTLKSNSSCDNMICKETKETTQKNIEEEKDKVLNLDDIYFKYKTTSFNQVDNKKYQTEKRLFRKDDYSNMGTNEFLKNRLSGLYGGLKSATNYGSNSYNYDGINIGKQISYNKENEKPNENVSNKVNKYY